MEKYTELARCVENIEKDASKFFVNGNKAAGTRARKHLQELKQLAQDLRVIIQDTKNEKQQRGGGNGNGSDEQQEMNSTNGPTAAQQAPPQAPHQPYDESSHPAQQQQMSF